jgi:hypothetical protein
MAHPSVPFSTARRHRDLVFGDPQGEEVAVIASALICGSHPSARRFPIACLPSVGYLCGVGFRW